jgi:hypothetical protein
MTRVLHITESTVLFVHPGRSMAESISLTSLLRVFRQTRCARSSAAVVRIRRSVRTQCRAPAARHRRQRQRRFRIVHRRRQCGVKRQADGPDPEPARPRTAAERVVANQLQYFAIGPRPRSRGVWGRP